MLFRSLFASHDHEFVSTVANRIVEITPHSVIDRVMGFEDYLEDAKRSGQPAVARKGSNGAAVNAAPAGARSKARVGAAAAETS